MKTTITTLIAAGACLAAATPASAVTYYGSDLAVNYGASSLSCQEYPCTVAQHHFADYGSAEIPRAGVITQWRVKLAAGSTATLRLLKGNDGYRGLDTGPTVTGTGGITSELTRIPLDANTQLTGIELDEGAVLTDHDDRPNGPSAMLFEGTLDPFQYRGVDGSARDELLSQVRVEPDVDDDGLGDETQDDCIGDCHAPPTNHLEDPTSTQNPPPTGLGSAPGRATANQDPYDAELAKRPPVKLTVDARAFFDTSESKPVIRAYFANDGRYPVKGRLRLLVGKKASLDGGPFELPTDRSGGRSFPVSARLARTLRRGGKVKLTLVASLTGENGTKRTVRRRVKAIGHGVTRAFDGTYSGTGGLKFTVTGGLVTDVQRNVQTFCPGMNRFVARTLATADAFPGMVNRRGAFSVRGNYDRDSVSYSGALKRNGTGSGKLSLFHTELTFGDGLRIDQCAGASNWTAKRVAK